MPTWLQIALRFAPMILSSIPQTQKIAGAVGDGIIIAESMPGASGADKKSAVMQMAANSITSVNAAAGKVVLDPQVTLAAASSAIDTTISVINLVHDAHASDLITPVK